MARILLAGYIGCGNLGDDSAMLGLIHALRDTRHEFTTLSGNPEETYRLFGIRSFPRRDKKHIKEALEESEALVFPGGSIFQDATSIGSVFYYEDLVSTAKKAGKKVLLLGQGVGPLKSFLSRGKALSAFNAADAITVRDPMALQALKDLGCSRPTRVAADSAFLLPTPTLGGEGESFTVGNMKAVGIAPKQVKEKGKDIAGLFGEFCKLLYQSGSMPVLITMDRGEDTPLIDEISKRQGGKVPDLRKVQLPAHLQQRIARMDTMVAMRLHAGILAATVGVPALMISYDPKVTAFARIMEMGNAVGLEGLTATRLLDAFTSFQKDRARNVKILERKRADQCSLAEISAQAVRDLLGS